MRKSVRDECDLILLPKQLWCSLKGSTDDETFSEVGWLFDNGRAITSRCIFSDAKLKASLCTLSQSVTKVVSSSCLHLGQLSGPSRNNLF